MHRPPSLPGYREFPIIIDGARRIGIIHHWDADGISCAARIIKRTEASGQGCWNASPEIGNFADLSAPAGRLMEMKPDIVLGLDLSTTAKVLGDLRKLFGSSRLVWIDHHSSPPTPPDDVIFIHSGEENSQSNSEFLSSLLGEEELDLLGAIGTCGDLGRGMPPGYAERIETATRNMGLTLGDVFEITDLLDSNYRSGSLGDVERAPWILAEGLENPLMLLEVDSWVQNKARVDREIEKIMTGDGWVDGQVLIKTISTRMNLISIVTRLLALNTGQDVSAVIVYDHSRDPSPIYVRRVDRVSPSLDLTPLIRLGREWGVSAGGKAQVVGMMIPRDELEPIREKILGLLEELI